MNNEMMVIDIGEKEYILGYPTRKDAVRAENLGLNIMDNGKLLSLTSKAFYTGLLAKQPKIKEDDAEKLMEQYIDEGGNIDEVSSFLVTQYTNFIKPQDSEKNKKEKKAKIIKI